MEHYYTIPENITGKSLIIEGDEAAHLAKVLRKDAGSEIYVTDGKGNLYKCRIESSGKDRIHCSISDKPDNNNEPDIKLTVNISILKNPARFEFAVEKLTELGVYEIQPVISERVISKGKDKSGRWQQIALSAMKQSQRTWLPAVNIPAEFREAIKRSRSEVKLIAHEKSSHTGVMPEHIKQGNKSIALFIGPEGGFTEDEIALAEENGFKAFSLGRRKYRSETAAVAAASLILLSSPHRHGT